jgi:hypothetical protein
MKRSPALVLVAACLVGMAEAAHADPKGAEFFEKKIRPVLVAHCYSCHSAEARTKKRLRGGLQLDTRDGLRKGGDSGPVVVPGKADESLLVQSLRYDGEVRMPPRQKLPEGVIADFKTWINQGAPDPRDGGGPARAQGMSVEEGRKFWAYRRVIRPAVPGGKDHGARGAIDRFIQAGLEEKGLAPARPGDRATLARRLYYDLAGLPPTLEELDAFLGDARIDAYERLVERLLASPAFGERWGRHWLDVARFAESLTLRGFVLAEAWRYRDLVIDTFNEDVPFDRFIQEQVAGDLLPAGSLEEKWRGRIATAFLAMGNTNLEEQDKKQLRMDVVDEQLDTIGRAFLAQTLGCARCHDHKFDPIPTKDYYALAGILRNTKTLTHANVSMWLTIPLPVEPGVEKVVQMHEAAVALLEKQIKEVRAAVAKAGMPANPNQTTVRKVEEAARLRRLEEELRKVQKSGPRRPAALSVLEEEKIEETRVHIRGSVHALGEAAPRGFLQVAEGRRRVRMPAEASGRRELGAWLADADNPLTARVFVNRAWHWLMGEGLVRTPDNFGTVGERPSHPELLDHLAANFVESGWSVKKLVRAIVLSRTYQQSSRTDARTVAADPENRLLTRANRRRLEAECIRDTMLAVSGALTRDHGRPTYRAGLATDYGYRHTSTRRSIYTPVFRNALPELFAVFDFADPSVTTGRRNVSTTAPQALFLMNNPFVLEQSRLAARRLLLGAEREGDRLTRAYRLVLGRRPSEGERRLAEELLARAGPEEAAREEAWSQMFQVLFASVDFRRVD